MLLEKHTAVRKGRNRDGKVMVMRCCSDCLEFTCWYDDVRLRGAGKAVGEACIPILRELRNAISPCDQQTAALPQPSSPARNSVMSAGGVLVACKYCERRLQDIARTAAKR